MDKFTEAANEILSQVLDIPTQPIETEPQNDK